MQEKNFSLQDFASGRKLSREEMKNVKGGQGVLPPPIKCDDVLLVYCETMYGINNCTCPPPPGGIG